MWLGAGNQTNVWPFRCGPSAVGTAPWPQVWRLGVRVGKVARPRPLAVGRALPPWVQPSDAGAMQSFPPQLSRTSNHWGGEESEQGGVWWGRRAGGGRSWPSTAPPAELCMDMACGSRPDPGQMWCQDQSWADVAA